MEFKDLPLRKYFWYLGHGSTLCNASGAIEVKRLDPGVSLMTTTVCGSPTYASVQEKFFNIASFRPEVFQAAVSARVNRSKLKENLINVGSDVEEISKKFFQTESDLYSRKFAVRLPGEIYGDMSFQAADAQTGILDREVSEINENEYVHPNGLYDMETLLDMSNAAIQRYEQELDQRVQFAQNAESIIPGIFAEGFPALSPNFIQPLKNFASFEDVFEYMYFRSRWPGPGGLVRDMKDMTLQIQRDPRLFAAFQSLCPLGWKTRPDAYNAFFYKYAMMYFAGRYRISVSELLEDRRFNGIHIWDICRSYDSSCDPNQNFEESFLDGGLRKNKIRKS